MREPIIKAKHFAIHMAIVFVLFLILSVIAHL